ncbi:MAG: sulfite exporter TauE/SafE family protein, partial [Bdellovibrionaceae bacterium]|nr:sulfite exporter TauE/SafE family protein [Pseudobdellovibrionaceae bacterium]
NKNVNFKIILFFAPFAMLGAYFGSYLASFISGETQLILFSLTVLMASFLMIKDQRNKKKLNQNNQLIFIVSGFSIGFVSGLVGIGGGFLIVPLLVILAGLPMKQAVGTSLTVMSLSSLTGFLGYIGQVQIPWLLLFKFVILSGLGIILGSHFIQYISPQKLKKSFGYFLIIMGFLMLIQNSYLFL